MKHKYQIQLLLLIIIALIFTFPVNAIEPGKSYLQTTENCDEVTIHYRRRNSDYDGWGLHVWGPTPLEGVVTWASPLEPTGQDDFGLYWIFQTNSGADHINYILHRGAEKDPGPDQVMKFEQVGCEIWQVQGRLDQFVDPDAAIQALVVVIEPSEPLGENQAILHYKRVNSDYDGWGLHIWGPTSVEGITWASPLKPHGQDEFGIYWIIDMQPSANNLEYIIHKGDQKDPGPDQKLDFEKNGREIWLVEGSGEQFLSQDDAQAGLIASVLGDIKNKAQAHWLTLEYIGWPGNFSQESVYTLHHDPRGLMNLTPDGLQGGLSIPLEYVSSTLNDSLAQKYPHLMNAHLLKIPAEYLGQVPDILKGQMAIKAADQQGNILGLTALQIPGVLDDLYANDEQLGVRWIDNIPSLKVWAPTAKSVDLILYNESTIEKMILTEDQNDAEISGYGRRLPMELDPATGIWSIIGDPSWRWKYYQFEVTVFVRQEGTVVTSRVTDPYSIGLSLNSAYSQIIDLKDPALVPANWDGIEKPVLDHFADSVLYELHIRDFSVQDQTVPSEQRGSYMSFTHLESDGMKHLNWLAEKGVTHIHLLPTFDFATINEDKSTWLTLDWEQLLTFPPDSDEQQKIINEIRGQDGFNWGYDPYHYTVPEGSYSVHPNGSIRTLEFRKMVQALNQTGLRVVMDVVYNHTHASGQSDQSVLDRVVPGYYHRLDMDGNVTTSTCCPNTATEHAMMRKLMIDSVLTWAISYKVDGFRFDLMGHHMKSDMEAVRERLNFLTLGEHGVDGSKIILYGEGWDFGEVADNARGTNATQINLAGTGIGTFNDRLRDSVRGGTPFTDPQEQGYTTGLYLDPNKSNQTSESEQLDSLLILKDKIRASLAGNLAEYQFINHQGETTAGADLLYGGKPSGYTQTPQENIVYVSAHDNETLFDAIQYKTPSGTSLNDRVRIQALSLSLVTYSQGIPFFHAGSELLRSKSMDRDSYDSTDWFNAIDWTYTTNNWGHGVPPEDKNGSSWSIIQPLLGNPDIVPGKDEIQTARNIFGKHLEIRSSTPLLRLRTSSQIQNLVRFHNTGPDQIPGLIVMSTSDDPSSPIDPQNETVFILFNADPQTISFKLKDYKVDSLDLHPLLADDSVSSLADFNPESQTFTVPGRSTVVFVSDNPLQHSEFIDKNHEEKPEQSIESPVYTAQPSQIAETTTNNNEIQTKYFSPLWIIGSFALLILLGLAGGFVYRRYFKG